jgi:transcriptional regulator GlxA family with amidase domain
LLDGARCGAPWMFQSWFAQRFPACDLSSDEPIGVHARVFHCVAPALQTEFMLRVLGHLHDPTWRRPWRAAAASARTAAMDAGTGVAALAGQDRGQPVYRAIGWLQAHVGEPYRLRAVAEAAAVSDARCCVISAR